jgi:hypothetical protein
MSIHRVASPVSGRSLAAILALAAAAAPALAEDFTVHTFKKIKLSDKFHCEGAYYGDFDKDGKIDVVAGPYWYAGPTFEKKTEIFPVKDYDPKGYSHQFLCYTHDVNADGWVDVIVVGFPGEPSLWYENPQNKEGHWKKHTIHPVTDNESPRWGDLDGDGKPELIFHTGGWLGWAAPTEDVNKDWKFFKASTKGSWQRYTHGFGFGDVNGDGRADLLEAQGWWEQPVKHVEEGWKFHKVRFGNGGAQMYAYDVDGDKDADIITSIEAHGYGLSWFENTGKDDKGEIIFKEHRITGSKPEDNKYGVKFSQLHAVDLIDMDGDGVKDIVTGKRWWAHGPGGDAEPMAEAVLYWFKTVRSGKAGEVEFIPYLIDNDSGVGTQITAGDLNGDGLPDVIVGNKKGSCVFIHEAKKVTKEEWEKAQPKVLEKK